MRVAQDHSRVGRSVVVGIDNSEESRDAALLGRRLANSARGELHLVSAADQVLLEVLATRARADLDRVQDGLIQAATEEAQTCLRTDFTSDELAGSLKVRLGRAEHVLAEYGKEVDADVFVLGGKHHADLGGWFRRGTVHHLLRVADRTVVATGPDGPRVDRVLVFVDRSPSAKRVLSVGHDLGQLLGVPVESVHVVARPIWPSTLDVGIISDEWLEQEVRAAKDELGHLLSAGAQLNVLQGKVEPVIRRMAIEVPGTLLVLGAHGRGRVHRLLLGSTTETLLADLPTTIAVVP